MNKLSVILVIVLSWFAQAYSQTPDPKQVKIDKLFERWNKPNSPGVAIAVVENGKLSYAKGYGSANLEYNIPITPKTVFHAASLSKQFTAFAILTLAKEGKLSLEDDVRKYVPEVPNFGKTITLRHLVTHTSGLRDQWRLLELAGWRLDDVITREQILRMVSRQKDLNFEPGQRFNYCNTGFTLLAEVVARISKMSFAEYTQKYIFTPLGMKNSQFYDDHEKLVKNRAYSYYQTDKGFKNKRLNFSVVGATSLFTTAEDLAIWALNFQKQTIGNDAIFKQMASRTKLNNGRKISVGMGQFLDDFWGLPVIYHTGSDAGYRLMLARFPKHNFAVALLSNVSNFDRELALAVSDIYLEKYIKKPTKKRKPKKKFVHDPKIFVKLSKAQLEKFAGKYWERDEWYTRKVYLKEGALWYFRRPGNENKILPISKNQFKMIDDTEDVTITFNNNGQGEPQMLFKINKRNPLVFLKYTSFDLKPYLGTYYSSELNTNYRLTQEDGKLVMNHTRLGKIYLDPIKPNLFKSKKRVYRKVVFQRDKNGKIEGLAITSGRMKDVRFKRVEASK